MSNSSDYTGFISMNELVSQYLIDIGAPNNNMYNSCLNWAIRGYAELEWDVLKKFKRVYLPVDSTTKTATLPTDFVQYTRIALHNQVNELIDLGYDPNLVVGDIEALECHCDDCGCTDEVCYAVSNTVLTETTAVISTPVVQCDYSVTLLFGQRQGLCANPIYPFTFISVTIDGFTTPITTVVANNTEYQAVLTSLAIPNIPTSRGIIGTNFGGGAFTCSTTVSYYTDYPMTIISYVKNGVTIGDGTIVADQAELTAYMLTLGWTLNDLAPNPNTYVIANSNDTWGAFNIESQTTAHQQAVVLNSSCSTSNVDVTYTNYCRTCTTSENTIIRECCNWGGQFVNECDYGIIFTDTRLGGFEFPLTDGIITINGLDVSIGTMDGISDLISYLEGLGFFITSVDPLMLRKTLSADSYGTISSVLQGITETFTESNCLNMEIVKTCNTETICNTTVAECGCVTLNDEIVNTLSNAGIINNTMYMRYINGGEIGTTWRQPYNNYGFYNVDVHKGIIQLDPYFRFDTIVLEYYANEEVKSKDFLVPVLARDYILSYIHKCSIQRKNNVPLYQIQQAQKQCWSDKHNLKLRWQPARYAQIKEINNTQATKP